MYDHITLDCETSKLPVFKPWMKDAFFSSLGIYFPDGTSKVWMFNPLIGDEHRHLKEIQYYLDNTELVVGHNIKFDLLWLKHIGLNVPSKVWCTYVGEYLLTGQDKTLGGSLNAVSDRYGLGQKVDEMGWYWEHGYNTDEIPVDLHTKYLTQDITLTDQLFIKQRNLIHRANLDKVAELTFAVTKILAEVEYRGAPFSLPSALGILERMKQENEVNNQLLIKMANVDFNPSSGDQLAAVLYGGQIKRDSREYYTVTLKSGEVKEKSRKCKVMENIVGMGFECPETCTSKKTGKPSSSKDTLSVLKATTPEQKSFLKVLKAQKNMSKVVSTLTGKKDDTGWIALLGDDGRLHGSFNQAFTVTGRLSSTAPNMQNLPRKGTSPLKTVFAPADDKVIVNCDLAQIEWRVAAELCRDECMLQELYDKVDIHSVNACAIFGADMADKDCGDEKREANFALLRQTAKTVSFRLLYGGSAEGFYFDARMPEFSLSKWKTIVSAFYKKYPGLKKWQDTNKKDAIEKGYIRTPSGRVLPFSNVDFANPREVKNFEREVCNYPDQSFSADINNIACVEADRLIKERGLDASLIILVHDSLVYEVSIDDAEELMDLVLDVYVRLPQLIKDWFDYDVVVPLFGDCEIGANYGSIHKVNKNNIASVLDELRELQKTEV